MRMSSRTVFAAGLAAALAGCAPSMSDYPGRVTEPFPSRGGYPATAVFSTEIAGGRMVYGLSVLAAPGAGEDEEVVIVLAEYPNLRLTTERARTFAARIESFLRRDAGVGNQIILGPVYQGHNDIVRLVLTGASDDQVGFSYQWGHGRTWDDRTGGDYRRVRIGRDYLNGFALGLRRAAAIAEGTGS